MDVNGLDAQQLEAGLLNDGLALTDLFLRPDFTGRELVQGGNNAFHARNLPDLL